MWIARNENGGLVLFKLKPQRHESMITKTFKCSYWETVYSRQPKYQMWLEDNDYPQFSYLSWSDEPVEVVISPTRANTPCNPTGWADYYACSSEERRSAWLNGWDRCRKYIKDEFGISV